MKPVPSIHLVMILATVAILILAMIMYCFRPGDVMFVSIISTCMGVLFGKFSNGFSSPRKPSSNSTSEDEK